MRQATLPEERVKLSTQRRDSAETTVLLGRPKAESSRPFVILLAAVLVPAGYFGCLGFLLWLVRILGVGLEHVSRLGLRAFGFLRHVASRRNGRPVRRAELNVATVPQRTAFHRAAAHTTGSRSRFLGLLGVCAAEATIRGRTDVLVQVGWRGRDSSIVNGASRLSARSVMA